MNKIELIDLKLKTFTKQDAEDYCQLNNINIDKVTRLDFQFNKLTDISGIKLFKNLKVLYLLFNDITDISVIQYLIKLQDLDISYTQIKDISVIQYLIKLQDLDIKGLGLESDQIQYIKNLKNLEILWCENGFKNMSVLNQLNKNIKIK